jgi:hypothetical protein
MKILKIAVVLLCLVFATACDPINDSKNFLVDVGILKIDHKPLPNEVKDEMNKASTGDAPKLSAGELAKENSEILAEMMKVIFDEKDIDNKTDFGNLVHTLNQGASLEGIYRGIVMGSRYRALETKAQAASPAELKAFAVEMAELQDSMKNPSVFTSDDAKKAPSIEFPDGSGVSDPMVPSAHEGSQEVTKKRDKTEVRNELLEIFIGASGYTLKRTMGDEALKKIDEVKSDPGDLGNWYAKFVLRMCDAHVDFGLELRNKPDFDLHFKFAEKMAIDRVKWEVLNRYHRYLNATAVQK